MGVREDLQRLGRLLQGRTSPSREGQEAITQEDWIPAVDVLETDTEFLLLVNLPGVGQDQVKVCMEGGVLTITGQRASQVEGSGLREAGTFARTFTLPDMVNEETLTAEYRHGVLTLHLSKAENAKPKSIEVKVQ